jgi:hypothetical protein
MSSNSFIVSFQAVSGIVYLIDSYRFAEYMYLLFGSKNQKLKFVQGVVDNRIHHRYKYIHFTGS